MRFNADSPLVFTAIHGRPLTKNAVVQLFRRWKDEIGAEHRHAHLLRQTNASQLANLGVPAQDIQMQLGHSTMAMTLKHLARAQREQARLRNSQGLLARIGVNVQGVSGS